MAVLRDRVTVASGKNNHGLLRRYRSKRHKGLLEVGVKMREGSLGPSQRLPIMSRELISTEHSPLPNQLPERCLSTQVPNSGEP